MCHHPIAPGWLPHRLCLFCYLTGISEGGPCGLGQYFENGVCKPCPIGTHMDDVSHTNTACTSCSAGYHAANEGQAECDPCLPGTHQPNIGEDSCQSCPPGRVTESIGMDTCNGCPPGMYSGWAASVCLDCESGFYCPGDSHHIPCPNGAYSEEQATTCLSSGTGYLSCPTHWRKEKFNGYEHCLKYGECGWIFETLSNHENTSVLHLHKSTRAESTTKNFDLVPVTLNFDLLPWTSWPWALWPLSWYLGHFQIFYHVTLTFCHWPMTMTVTLKLNLRSDKWDQKYYLFCFDYRS